MMLDAAVHAEQVAADGPAPSSASYQLASQLGQWPVAVPLQQAGL